MKLGPLTIWQRMTPDLGPGRRSISVLSLHWPWSITWRLSVTKAPWYAPPGKQGFSIWRTHRGMGLNFHACFNTKLTGHWSIQTQPNMLDRGWCARQRRRWFGWLA